MALRLWIDAATSAALPMTGCENGQTAYTTSDNKRWYWNGTVWTEQPGGGGGGVAKESHIPLVAVTTEVGF